MHPKGTVTTSDVPEILEEPLIRCSSFFGLDIPLVSLKVFAFSPVNLLEEVKEAGLSPRNLPKIQDGFTGPGTSLITESLLRLRGMAYTRIPTQIASAPS